MTAAARAADAGGDGTGSDCFRYRLDFRLDGQCVWSPHLAAGLRAVRLAPSPGCRHPLPAGERRQAVTAATLPPLPGGERVRQGVRGPRALTSVMRFYPPTDSSKCQSAEFTPPSADPRRNGGYFPSLRPRVLKLVRSRSAGGYRRSPVRAARPFHPAPSCRT